MKTAAVLFGAAPVLASAVWYEGAPQCAQSCLSTAWNPAPTVSGTVTTTSAWPAQTEYCDANKGNSVGACVSSACKDSGDKTAFSSYSSMSSSICSAYSSCTKDSGKGALQTLTYGAGPVTWAAPGGWGATTTATSTASTNAAQRKSTFPGSIDENRGYWSEWAQAYSGSATWTGGVVTVTGCAGFNGSPWFVGPDCGWNDKGGFDGWVGWGEGWKWGPTETETVTWTTTTDSGSTYTTSGVETVALAVSGSYTRTETLHSAQETDSSGNGDDGNSDNQSGAAGRVSTVPGADGNVMTGVMGIALGSIVLIAAVL